MLSHHTFGSLSSRVVVQFECFVHKWQWCNATDWTFHKIMTNLCSLHKFFTLSLTEFVWRCTPLTSVQALTHCFLMFVSLPMVIHVTTSPMPNREISVADFSSNMIRRRPPLSSFIKFTLSGLRASSAWCTWCICIVVCVEIVGFKYMGLHTLNRYHVRDGFGDIIKRGKFGRNVKPGRGTGRGYWKTGVFWENQESW